MSEVILKIPRSTKSAKVVMPDFNNPDDVNYFNKKHSLALIANRIRQQAKKVVFTEKFVISDSNQPLQISLNKVAQPSLTLEEAKIEIQNAYNKGFKDGQEASEISYLGDIEGFKNWILNFDKLSLELRSEYTRQVMTFGKLISKTAIMVAEHLITQEISTNSEIVLNRFRKAIELVDEETVFKIILNPEDVAALEKVESEFYKTNFKLERIEIITDDKIKRGGCILHTSAGIIDISLESQLKKLESSISEISNTEELM